MNGLDIQSTDILANPNLLSIVIVAACLIDKLGRWLSIKQEQSRKITSETLLKRQMCALINKFTQNQAQKIMSRDH